MVQTVNGETGDRKCNLLFKNVHREGQGLVGDWAAGKGLAVDGSESLIDKVPAAFVENFIDQAFAAQLGLSLDRNMGNGELGARNQQKTRQEPIHSTGLSVSWTEKIERGEIGTKTFMIAHIPLLYRLQMEMENQLLSPWQLELKRCSSLWNYSWGSIRGWLQVRGHPLIYTEAELY